MLPKTEFGIPSVRPATIQIRITEHLINELEAYDLTTSEIRGKININAHVAKWKVLLYNQMPIRMVI